MANITVIMFFLFNWRQSFVVYHRLVLNLWSSLLGYWEMQNQVRLFSYWWTSILLPFAAIIIKLLCRPYCGILPLLISIGKRPRAAFLDYKIASWLLFCHFDKITEQMPLRGERTDFNSQSLGRVFGGEEVMAMGSFWNSSQCHRWEPKDDKYFT